MTPLRVILYLMEISHYIRQAQYKKGFITPLLLALIALLLIGGGVYVYIQNKQVNSNDSNVSFQNMSFNINCFPFQGMQMLNYLGSNDDAAVPILNKAYAISSQREYEKLIRFRSTSQECKNISLPVIDFNSRTLLGLYDVGSCAVTGFEKTVTQDTTNKTFIYSTKPKTGFFTECRSGGHQDMNWITVSKIPSDYSITFVLAGGDPPFARFFVPDGKGDWFEESNSATPLK